MGLSIKYEIAAMIAFYFIMGCICVGACLFFSILILQIPLSCFTNFYLYNGLSEKDYNLAQARLDRDFVWMEQDLYSEEELESHLKRIKQVLSKHKLCCRYYFFAKRV